MALIKKATTLEEASINLDWETPLDPADKETFDLYYVERGLLHSPLLRRSKTSLQTSAPFNWFFTGHTGAGKSTELNRILNDKNLQNSYQSVRVDMLKDFDTANIEFPDVIVGMAKACVLEAEKQKCKISTELTKNIKHWGDDVKLETDKYLGTQGKAKLGLSAFFGSLSEEIKTGGTKRTTIRESLYSDITQFIKLLDQIVATIEKECGKPLLCVIDGLDHVNDQHCYEMFSNNFSSLTKPQFSKIFLIPLFLINTDFRVTIQTGHSVLPNTKVYQDANSKEISPEGLNFFEQLISRHMDLNLLTPEARTSLFELSAGVVRDMLRLTSNACGLALDSNAKKVTEAHVELVWNETMAFYRSILLKNDYVILREVKRHPYPEGVDGVAALLYRKAVYFYPNGEGWYGVHPAITRILKKE